MKKILLFSLVIFSQILLGAEITKEIKLKEVTVYLRGAKVYGTVPLNLTQGRNVVRINNLPNDLNDNSYKINLNNLTTLLSITPGIQNWEEVEKPEVIKNLESQKKSVQREMSLIQIQIKNLLGEQAIINANLKIYENDKTTPQEQLEQLTAFYAKRMVEIDIQLFELNEQILILNESISEMDKEINEKQAHNINALKYIELEIHADKATQLDLGISYLVQNATWIPTYDLKAENVMSPFEIIYKGKINQNTGQNWENVKLFVSTYQPKFNHDRPILSPMYVTENANLAMNLSDYEMKKENALSNSYQMRDEVGSDPIATAFEQTMNVLYELNYQQSIKSQPKEQYVILNKKEVDAEYVHHVVPKLSNAAYLLAKVKNWHTLDLVPGEAQVYFQDNFVGKTQIATNYVKDDFPISLGIDERVVVKRIKIEDKNTEKALNSNKKEVESYEISIRNNSKQPIDLEVLDQIPISETNQIVVKVLEKDGGELDDKTGSILWKKNLSAGSSEDFNFSYEIKYPKDSQIAFYNR